MAKTPKTKYQHGAIVPSKCRHRKSKKSAVDAVVPFPQKPGFEVQDASGNTFLLNDWPATGGPWVPGINITGGTFVWVNTGG